MIIHSLREILQERDMTQRELSERTGLSEAEISRLCSIRIITDDSREGPTPATCSKICKALGIGIEQLLDIDEPSFLSIIKSESQGLLSIAVGSRPAMLLQPDEDQEGYSVKVNAGGRRDMVGLWDVRAVGEVTRRCPWQMPHIVETPCTLNMEPQKNMPESIDRLLQSGRVIVGIGSPLVLGLADWTILEIQKVYNLPFEFHWNFGGGFDYSRSYNKFDKTKTLPQGIKWKEAKEEFITIPSWKEICNLDPGKSYDDGGVICVWPNNYDSWLLSAEHIRDLSSLARKLQEDKPPTNYLRGRFSDTTQQLLNDCAHSGFRSRNLIGKVKKALVDELNQVIQGYSILRRDGQHFNEGELREETLEQSPRGMGFIYQNRLLLEDIFPDEIERNKVRQRTWIALAMGFAGPGTFGATYFLFSETFEEILSKYLEDPAVIPGGDGLEAPPLFVAIKVKCEKQGHRGSDEVYPVEVSDGLEIEVVGYHFSATKQFPAPSFI